MTEHGCARKGMRCGERVGRRLERLLGDLCDKNQEGHDNQGTRVCLCVCQRGSADAFAVYELASLSSCLATYTPGFDQADDGRGCSEDVCRNIAEQAIFIFGFVARM